MAKTLIVIGDPKNRRVIPDGKNSEKECIVVIEGNGGKLYILKDEDGYADEYVKGEEVSLIIYDWTTFKNTRPQAIARVNTLIKSIHTIQTPVIDVIE